MTEAKKLEAAAKMASAIEAIVALLEAMKQADADPRGIATARTQFETALLWSANAMGGESII